MENNAPKRRAAQLEKRYGALKRALVTLGPVLQGSILRRTITRDDPAHPGHNKDYGPYYQWTRKVQGRTVIQNLTASQAKTYARAIRENKTLEKTLAEMRAISLKMLELTTKGVPKRAARRKINDRLS